MRTRVFIVGRAAEIQIKLLALGFLHHEAKDVCALGLPEWEVIRR